MGEPDENRAFIPFNFSSVLPFDAISNALRELPTPQHAEPKGPFSQLPQTPNDAPSQQELVEMTRLVAITAHEDEWSRDVISDISSLPDNSEGRRPSAWLNKHSQDVVSALQRNLKRATATTPQQQGRQTPKRPRPRPSQEIIDVDNAPSNPEINDPSESARRRWNRRHQPQPDSSRRQDLRQASDSVPPRHSPQHAHPVPRGITAPQRAMTTTPQRVSPNQRSIGRNLSHAQELRRHEDVRDVESEDFEKFLLKLQSFSERPDALVSTTYDADEPPALLATGNLGVITELRQAIALVAPTGGIKHAEPQLLANVISILQARVRCCARQCQGESTSNSSKFSSRDASLGVLAVCTILDILAAPEAPRSLLVEELLDDIVVLLRSVMTQVIFPMCDPQYKNSKANTRKKRKQGRSTRRAADEVTVLSDDDERDEEASPKAGKARRWAILKKDEDLLTHCRLFLDGLTDLFKKEKFIPDSIVSQCTTVCIQCLSVFGISRLQHHAVQTMCMVFSNYLGFRLSIMDDVRETAGIVPEAKRHLRSFQLAEGNISVRTTTALLGMLLCMSSYDLRSNPTPKQLHNLSPDAVKAWCGEREMCHKRAVKFAVHVLKPMFTKVSEDREQDYKLAFQTFFEDLLILFGRPEWPCAELLLQSLSVSIITKMRSGTEKTAHARGVAIDTLGSLAARMSKLHGKRLVKQIGAPFQFNGSDKDVEEARENILLFFNPEKSLHSASVEAFYEAMFVNDDYSFANNHDRRSQAIANQRNTTDDNEEDDVIDGQDGEGQDKESIVAEIERRAIKRTENVRSRRARGEEVSREDALAASQLISLKRNFVGGFKTILGAIFDGLQDSAPTIRTKAIKALSSMDEACPGILRAFPNILKDVGPSCRDVSTLVRDAALDLISRSLLAGLKDNKQANTDPSNNHETENLFSSIFEVVLKRLWDSATSVRKRSIGIMKAVLANSLDHCKAALNAPASAVELFKTAEIHKQRIILVCTSLVSRLEDPESTVKEAAERTLRFGLFGFDISQSIPAKNDHMDVAPQLTERFIGVFTKLPPNIHLSFISRVVHKAILIKQAKLLHAIVNSAVEQFHSFEERIATMYGGLRSDGLSDEERKEIVILSKRKVACTSLISAFGSLDSSLIENHCRALAPSIKGVSEGNLSENDLITVQRILNVLEVGIGQSKSADPSFLKEVLKDVELIVCHSPIPILEEASVRCLTVVAGKISDDSSEAVLRVADTFKTFLDTRIGEELIELLQSPDSKREESIARCALVRLGLLAKYGDFDENSTKEVFKTLQEVADLVCEHDQKGLLSRAVVRALSHFLIKNRGFLPVGTERLVSMLESSVVKNSSNPARSHAMMSILREVQTVEHGIKLCVFQGFHELLRDEEERNTTKTADVDSASNERRNGTKKEANGNSKTGPASTEEVVLAAEEDAEAGYLALSAQAMIPSLKKAVNSSSLQIRRVVANVLGLLVRQGLLLPATIVPSLFTLSLDLDCHCRDYAYRVINFIADRHSGMLASAAVPALRVCFKTAFEVHANSPNQLTAAAAAKGHAVFTNLRKLSLPSLTEVCIDGKTGHALLSPAIMVLHRDQRRGVLENLVKEFDPRVVVVMKRSDRGSSGTATVTCSTPTTSTHNSTATDDHAGPTASIRKATVADDVVDVGDGDEIDLQGGLGRCELADAYFFAMTLACVDYTNGAGVGGSLSHGGGTAAADIKLKQAREEVNDLVGTATRIISNSGQAVLRVARQIMQQKDRHRSTRNADGENDDAGGGEDGANHIDGDGEFSKKKRRVAMFAARICLLLSLKYHLKVERWKAHDEDVRSAAAGGGGGEDGLGAGNGNAASVRMPAFQPDCELLETLRLSTAGNDFEDDGDGGAGTGAGTDADGDIEMNGATIEDEIADRQIERLVRMMREDAIDEADLTVPSRRGGGRSTGRAKGRVPARRRKTPGTADRERVSERYDDDDDGDNRAMMALHTSGGGQAQRRRGSKRASTTKRLTYDDGSDNDGSDYDPTG